MARGDFARSPSRYGFFARVLLDSISPAGVRLTTMEATFHRFILPELNTHRAFSQRGKLARDSDQKSYRQGPRRSRAAHLLGQKSKRHVRARRDRRGARQRAQTEWRRALANALESAERLAEFRHRSA